MTLYFLYLRKIKKKTKKKKEKTHTFFSANQFVEEGREIKMQRRTYRAKVWVRVSGNGFT